MEKEVYEPLNPKTFSKMQKHFQKIAKNSSETSNVLNITHLDKGSYSVHIPPSIVFSKEQYATIYFNEDKKKIIIVGEDRRTIKCILDYLHEKTKNKNKRTLLDDIDDAGIYVKGLPKHIQYLSGIESDYSINLNGRRIHFDKMDEETREYVKNWWEGNY